MAFPVAGGGYQVGDGNENSVLFYIQPAPVSFTVDPTPTALQLAGIALFIGTPAGGINFTLPTVAALESSFQSMGEKPNTAFEFVIINTAAQNITVTTNTGWTVTGGGSMVVNNASARFQARKTGAGAWQVYRIA